MSVNHHDCTLGDIEADASDSSDSGNENDGAGPSSDNDAGTVAVLDDPNRDFLSGIRGHHCVLWDLVKNNGAEIHVSNEKTVFRIHPHARPQRQSSKKLDNGNSIRKEVDDGNSKRPAKSQRQTCKKPGNSNREQQAVANPGRPGCREYEYQRAGHSSHFFNNVNNNVAYTSNPFGHNYSFDNNAYRFQHTPSTHSTITTGSSGAATFVQQQPFATTGSTGAVVCGAAGFVQQQPFATTGAAVFGQQPFAFVRQQPFVPTGAAVFGQQPFSSGAAAFQQAASLQLPLASTGVAAFQQPVAATTGLQAKGNKICNILLSPGNKTPMEIFQELGSMLHFTGISVYGWKDGRKNVQALYNGIVKALNQLQDGEMKQHLSFAHDLFLSDSNSRFVGTRGNLRLDTLTPVVAREFLARLHIHWD